MMGLWGKARELERSPWPKIVTVGVKSGDHLLTGRRRDNQLWTSPGGHMDEGEDIMSAGRREVLEETGIDLTGVDLHLIRAERLVSYRTGKPFVVFAFVANINETKASSASDPDDEVEEWRWVKIDPDTPELQLSARHAKDDFVLSHLALGTIRAAQGGPVADKKETPVPEDKGRKQKDVSQDLQTAGFKESPEPPPEPSYPEPGKLTPEEMKGDPLADAAEGEREADPTARKMARRLSKLAKYVKDISGPRYKGFDIMFEQYRDDDGGDIFYATALGQNGGPNEGKHLETNGLGMSYRKEEALAKIKKIIDDWI